MRLRCYVAEQTQLGNIGGDFVVILLDVMNAVERIAPQWDRPSCHLWGRDRERAFALTCLMSEMDIGDIMAIPGVEAACMRHLQSQVEAFIGDGRSACERDGGCAGCNWGAGDH